MSIRLLEELVSMVVSLLESYCTESCCAGELVYWRAAVLKIW